MLLPKATLVTDGKPIETLAVVKRNNFSPVLFEIDKCPSVSLVDTL